ncbi:MAG: MarR family transcriptional regulator, organic hydroperoxide resistance regulator [Thermoleophilaceae bacterium]|jgi:DNA-binding MarR family transcriptional regulator|nr:MarR family transcriptional regulator, organic hydroperoxide resistance regulator [Thermoleophilaceae bacterium]
MSTATTAAAADPRDIQMDEARAAFGELLGAERRLRGRDQHRHDGLSHAQVRALFLLRDEHEATAGQIAKHAELSAASVTAMLDQLEAVGVVERRRAEEDRRVCVVTLTDSGRALVEQKRELWRELWHEQLADLPAEDLAAAVRVMRRMARAIDAL